LGCGRGGRGGILGPKSERMLFLQHKTRSARCWVSFLILFSAFTFGGTGNDVRVQLSLACVPPPGRTMTSQMPHLRRPVIRSHLSYIHRRGPSLLRLCGGSSSRDDEEDLAAMGGDDSGSQAIAGGADWGTERFRADGDWADVQQKALAAGQAENLSKKRRSVLILDPAEGHFSMRCPAGNMR